MDLKACVRDLLVLAGSGTLGVCLEGDVVCGAFAPGWSNQRSGVSIQRGGGGLGDVGEDNGVLSIWCYGGGRSDAAADAVADAVIGDLHNVVNELVTAGRVVSAQCTSRTDDWDTDFEPAAPVVVLGVSVTVG